MNRLGANQKPVTPLESTAVGDNLVSMLAWVTVLVLCATVKPS